MTHTRTAQKPLSMTVALAIATMLIAQSTPTVTAAPDALPGGTILKPPLTEFRATLLQTNEAASPPFTGAYGTTRATFIHDTNTLNYEVSVTGIPSATASHIHRAPIGVSGPVVVDLLAGKVLSDGGTIRGSVVLTPAQVAQLFAGNYYVNVHTVAFPGGELRGQLFPREAVRAFGTQLSGEREVPPVASSGSGSALVLLSDAQDEFAFFVNVTGIPSATLAHIHEGPTSGIGPVVFDLLALGGGTLDPATPISGTSPISPSQVISLRDGGFYVNVHTVANPTGELRGQLEPNETLLQAALSGANEVPPVGTAATGLGVFDLTRHIGNLDFGMDVTGIPSATGAHIHEAPIGVNGPVIFDLLAAGGGALGTATTLSGAVSLSATQAITLLNGGYYANVHTVAHPAGEIRGQIGAPKRYQAYRAILNGANELPTPITTTAIATASLVLDSLTNELTYKVVTDSFTTTAVIVGMHIHTGTITETGLVAFGLDLSGTGVVTLTNEQVYRLLTGGYYINIHTSANPGGEIRGQVYPTSIASRYFAGVLGIYEVPPVTTTASGAAFFVLGPNQTELSYEVTVNTSGPVVQAVHIHRGSPGQNGPVLYTLFSGGTFGPGRLAGKIAITPDDLNNLLLNMLYVNAHTAANPSGEIRGNISPERRVALSLIARNWPLPFRVVDAAETSTP